MSTVTEQHIQQYKEEGYCHVKGLIPADLMANAWARVRKIIDHPPMFRKSRVTYEPFKRHRIPLDQIDYTNEVLVEMKPGDGLFFTNYTWHRSEPNRTGKTMAFYAIAYQLKDRV